MKCSQCGRTLTSFVKLSWCETCGTLDSEEMGVLVPTVVRRALYLAEEVERTAKRQSNAVRRLLNSE